MSAFDNLHEIAPNVIWNGVISGLLATCWSTSAIELEPETDVPEHSHVNEQIGISPPAARCSSGSAAKEQDLLPGADLDHPEQAVLGPVGLEAVPP